MHLPGPVEGIDATGKYLDIALGADRERSPKVELVGEPYRGTV
jgi:hypothetical protein